MKTLRKIMAVTFVLLLVIAVTAHILLPDRTYSKTEKRNLQKFPAFSLSTLWSGRFMDETESYIADQFPLRDGLMSVKTALLRVFGRNESQGVYAMKNGTLAERFDAPERNTEKERKEAIKAFLERHKDTRAYFMLVPNAVSVYQEQLPAFAPTDDQNGYMDEMRTFLQDSAVFIDVREAFQAVKEKTQLYYGSDHHWTTEGAYEAFKTAASVMNLKAETAFSPVTVSNSFYGSLVSESGFSVAKPDAVTIFQEKGDGTLYTVLYSDENRRTSTAYETKALSGDDPYQVFFGGNHPLIEIDTDAGNGKSLLLIKDSYANAMIPFLIPEYERITVVDPRYYYEDIDALMGRGYTDLLFLYNVNTLSEDMTLRTVMINEQ